NPRCIQRRALTRLTETPGSPLKCVPDEGATGEGERAAPGKASPGAARLTVHIGHQVARSHPTPAVPLCMEDTGCRNGGHGVWEWSTRGVGMLDTPGRFGLRRVQHSDHSCRPFPHPVSTVPTPCVAHSAQGAGEGDGEVA